MFSEFEGTRIPHLVKSDDFKPSQPEEQQNGAAMDDYVLKRLFKKTGKYGVKIVNRLLHCYEAVMVIVCYCVLFDFNRIDVSMVIIESCDINNFKLVGGGESIHVHFIVNNYSCIFH